MAGYDRPGWPGWPGLGDPDESGEPGPARGPRPDPDDQLPPPPPEPVAPPGAPGPPGPPGPLDYGAHRGPDPLDDLWAPAPDLEPQPEPEQWEPDDWEREPEPVPRRSRRSDQPRKSAHRRGNILWRWRRPLFIAALLVMALIAAGVSAVAQVELPDAAALNLSSYVCTAEIEAGQCTNGNAAARLSGDENRDYVTLDHIPEVLRQAVIAAEDRDFYEHDGIDPFGIARALYQDIRGGGLSQGGSTITQQFVKNTYLGGGTSERTITRKIREAVLAIKAEQEMSKDEILEGYLNTIYFGRRAYGVQAAARVYFNMDLSDPNFGVAQAAYLAALIRAPGRADAHDPEHPEQLEEATRRRTTVLDAMVEEGYITQGQQDEVEAIPVDAYVVEKSSSRTTTALWGGADTGGFGMEYVNEYVRDQAKEILVGLGWSEDRADRALSNGGLRIYTTIDRTMQQQAYGAVWGVLNDPINDPGAGLVAIDDQGQIRAMVGGRDYWADNNYAQINFATDIHRQVGSTFKPIVLATAAANNVSFEQTELTAPAEKEIPPIQDTQCDTGTYHNYRAEEAETGTLDLYQATAASSNTAFAELMYEMGNEFGPDAVPQMAERLGWDDASAAEDEGGLSRCIPTVLGSEESNPLEMAEVYSTFANRGVHKEPTIITRIDQVDTDGETNNLWAWQPETENVLSTNAADLVTSALEGVIDHGTGTRADIGRPAAGKTGTTSNSKDSWFVGFTPHLTAAVWMGYAEANWTDPERTDCNHAQTSADAPDFCEPEIPPMTSAADHSVQGIASMTGGQLPARIWHDFMSQALTNIPPDGFNEPSQELRQQGEPLGDGLPAEPPPTDTTLPPDTTPQTTTVTTAPPTTIEPPPTSSTTDTTLFPFPTSTTAPQGGGGGGGGRP